MASNLALLEDAARKLKHLVNEVVFVGGSTLDLMITDPAASPVRPTTDVDIIVEIMTYADYVVAFSERLRALGFAEDMREGAPPCRWTHHALTLDVMPLDEAVLGFSNRWYQGAMAEAQEVTLPDGQRIRVISGPYFLGTKLEAFRGRGAEDYFASRDLEDFVAVLEGRPTILEEVAAAPLGLRQFLREGTARLLTKPRFLDALPGYFRGDSISQQRIVIVLRTLKALAELR
jgi:predicted nucleotidyltransferase